MRRRRDVTPSSKNEATKEPAACREPIKGEVSQIALDLLRNGGHPLDRAFADFLSPVFAFNDLVQRTRRQHELGVQESFRQERAKEISKGTSNLKAAIRVAKRENSGCTYGEIAEATDRQLEGISFRKVCPKSWLFVDNGLKGLAGALNNKKLRPRVSTYISKV